MISQYKPTFILQQIGNIEDNAQYYYILQGLLTTHWNYSTTFHFILEMRQRHVAADDEPADDKFVFRLPSSLQSEFPGPDELLDLYPDAIPKHGFLQKRNTSLIVQIAPCCVKKWKPRYFVVLGGYLYRYSSYPQGKAKGFPIPLDACTIRVLEEGDVTLDPGDEYPSCFEVSMIRKQYIFKASSSTECREWVSALKARKLQSIKEGLGHAPLNPAIRALNSKSAKKFNRRIDLDRKEGEERTREFMNNTSFNPMGGMAK